ncbi:MAG: hypothetical protein ACOYOK_15210 [Pseudobdellovibrionaceae bacterium]
MKKIILLLAAIGFSLQLTGCTSKESKDDAESAEIVDESGSLEEPSDKPADASADLATDGTTSAELSEDNLDAPIVEEPANDPVFAEAPKEETPSEAPPAVAKAEEPPAPPISADPLMAAPGEGMPADPLASGNTTEITPPAFATEPSDTTANVDSPSKASLQKVAATPWKSGKVWVNAVYFAKPSESLESISKEIYGNTDKVTELGKINPRYVSGKLRAGDKVYYNSPKRPDDSQSVLTYYEDKGIAPEIYVAKSGDNLKKVSKELLGYDGAWKEVWSSNQVESKSELSDGTEIRYWKVAASEVSVPSTSEAEVSNPQQPVAEAPPAMDASLPPPPMAANELPPPPPAMEELPPPAMDASLPPPPVAANELPPPPPAMEEPHNDQKSKAASGMTEEATASTGEESPLDDTTTTALAGVVLLAAGAGLIVVVRKRRKQKEFEQAIQDTQVGT